MIRILTSDWDLSSDIVIEWLYYHEYPFFKLTLSDILNGTSILELKDGNIKISINDKYIDINDINAIWFRKFGFFKETEFMKKASIGLDANQVSHLSREIQALISFFLSIFKNKFFLTDPQATMNLNKLEVLKIASQCGFSTPKTIITNHYDNLYFEGEYIVKAISDPVFMHLKDKTFLSDTNQLIKYDNIPKKFFPSLIQYKIEKEFEVRVFYLLGRCYSMAIFSQSDQQTTIDFRRYNWNNPNRFIPYNFPKKECGMIKKLMNKLHLNCASIDLIKGKDDFYFLEVNPTGQFGMVDFPCNYGLHRKVAELLINVDKKNEK